MIQILGWLNNDALRWAKTLIPLVTGLAWPVLVGFIVLGFRKPLVELIGRIRRIKGAGVTADFAEAVGDLVDTSKDSSAPPTDTRSPEPPDESPEPDDGPDKPEDPTPPVINPDAVALKRRREAGLRRAFGMGGRTDEPPQLGTRPEREWRLHFPNGDILVERANDNPAYSILTGYVQLERWFDRALLSHGISQYRGHEKLSVEEMSRLALGADLISQETNARVGAITRLRNIAAHTPDDITKFMALDFLYGLDDLFIEMEREIPPATVELGPDWTPFY